MIERATNVPRHNAIRARLVNGVSVLVELGSDAKLNDWILAMIRVAGDSFPSTPLRADNIGTRRDSGALGSNYLSYPSASSFVI